MPHQQSTAAAGKTRASRLLWLLLAYAGLVIYLTTYPWNFDFDNLSPLLTARLAPGRASLVDIVLNGLLLFPLGFLAPLAWRRSGMTWLVIPAAFLLSLSIELMQTAIPGRTSSAIDLTANTLGCAFGYLLSQLSLTLGGGALGQHFDMPHPERRFDFRCLWLLVIWLVAYTFPFIPSYRSTHWRDAWAALWNTPDPMTLLRGFITMMLVGALLRLITRPFLPRAASLGVVLVLLASTFAFPGRTLSAAFLAASVLGAFFAIWFLADRSPAWLAGIALAYLATRQLSPFTFTATGKQLSWMPFVSLFQITQAGGVRIVAEKLMVYGASLYFLWHAFGRLLPATLLCAGLLATGEFLQLWLPGRVPDSLDPLLVFVAAFAFLVLPGPPVHSPRKSQTRP
jgi:VanZ family protein